jgi:hypothetical protein
MSDEEVMVWARFYMEERRAGNPNALHRADARLALWRMVNAK